jgi:RNA polymerase sigma factor (sigma-70 family)
LEEIEDVNILVDGCIVGNSKALELFYMQFYAFCMQIAQRYARDDDDANNIISGAFLKIFKNIKSFDEQKGNIYGWVKRIVINEAIDFTKARRKFSSYEEVNDELQQSVDNNMVQYLSAKDILQLIRKLPQATQSVFTLYVVEGFSHNEIGTLLKITAGTSRWHLNNARKILQQQINELNKE